MMRHEDLSNDEKNAFYIKAVAVASWLKVLGEHAVIQGHQSAYWKMPYCDYELVWFGEWSLEGVNTLVCIDTAGNREKSYCSWIFKPGSTFLPLVYPDNDFDLLKLGLSTFDVVKTDRMRELEGYTVGVVAV